jgi:hypothetical protein
MLCQKFEGTILWGDGSKVIDSSWVVLLGNQINERPIDEFKIGVSLVELTKYSAEFPFYCVPTFLHEQPICHTQF